MSMWTRTAPVGSREFAEGGEQITCELCGQTLEAAPVWLDPESMRRFTAELGYFREYTGIVLRIPY